MNPLAHHFVTMAGNNAWSNFRLHGACAQLTPAEFQAPRVGFFPSLKATLNHLLTVDWYYLDAMERSVDGRPPNPEAVRFFEPAEPFEDCEALLVEQRQVDLRLLGLCRRIAREGVPMEHVVRVPRRAHVSEDTLERLLSHLFQHQIHHRGQAHAMLSGTPVAPPQLDEFFCAGDAGLRAPDLAALGLAEEDFWPPAAGG